jgi:hypothetical protein
LELSPQSSSDVVNKGGKLIFFRDAIFCWYG